ncbi:cupin domain-containing protein [Planctomicrobium sp. SH661]|uniref:cupin domain-containing protein n=1 Tax=Planctomicrobium sp. SH661 TaxID=3448124 RepID=UPI003F5AEE1C
MITLHPENLFNGLPSQLPEELFTVLIENQNVRIERIVSMGHSSPDGFWYDQDEHEWVIVLKGEAKLAFDNGEVISMKTGDHLLIPAHRKHRVEWTSANESTIWLGVFIAVE